MPLFKDQAAFLEHVPALESIDFGMVSKATESIEREVFRDQVLGPTEFDALQTHITALPTAIPAPYLDLSKLVLRALGNLGAARAIGMFGIQITSGGPMVAESEHTKAAPMWKTKMAIAEYLAMGYTAVDQVIAHLTENEGDFGGWAEAPVRTEVRESFIKSAKDAQRHIRIGGRAWLLHNLRPAMRDAQAKVKAILGATAHDTLLTAYQTGSTTTAQREQLDHIQPAILNLALAESIVDMSLTLDTDGLWQWKAATSGQVSGGPNPADTDRLDSMVRRHKAKGLEHLEQLQTLVAPNESTGFTGHAQDGSYFMG